MTAALTRRQSVKTIFTHGHNVTTEYRANIGIKGTPMLSQTLRLRKTSPIDREFCVDEVVTQDGNIAFDIGKSDDGTFEIALFDDKGTGRVLPLAIVLDLIRQAQKHIAEEA